MENHMQIDEDTGSLRVRMMYRTVLRPKKIKKITAENTLLRKSACRSPSRTKMIARTDPFRRNQHHQAPRAAEAASARLASDKGLLRAFRMPSFLVTRMSDSELVVFSSKNFQNNGQFYLRRIDIFSFSMLKLDKRKLGIRSTNIGLAGIFLAGIIVGIVLTVLAISSLPDAGDYVSRA
jgi:hypothetical protein